MGLVGINFWRVSDIPLMASVEESEDEVQPVHLVCSPVGGYQWDLLFHDVAHATLLLYEWVLNTTLFGPSALTALIWALRCSHRRVSISTHTSDTCFPLATSLCALYGLANTPIVCVRLLSIVASATTVTELPDHEVGLLDLLQSSFPLFQIL